MRLRSASVVCLAALILAACGGGSPSSPSDGPSLKVLEGLTLNALDGAAASGVNVQLGFGRTATTDANGYFRIDVSGPSNYTVAVRGGTIVDRDTTINGPTGEPARLTLIPSAFDLDAFDEMFRFSNSRLQRWTERPSLVVLGTVMTYRERATDTFTATGDQLSDDDVAQLVAHLEEGLAVLTGRTFTTFANVDVERPAAGEKVAVQRTGKIVVGRYQGVQSLANTIGYGQWAETSTGAVVGGTVYLDEGFDRADGRRRLLRIHELGHALGYTHVTKRPSIMNPSIGPDVQDFDRSGATIAFQRPPGNRSPDADPSAGGGLGTHAERRGDFRWAAPVPCGR